MRKKLYIASWGNPLAWRRVKYQCNGNVRESISSIVCAEADKYVIYVQDSVITAVIKSASNDLNEVVDAAKKAGLRVERRQLGNNEEIVVKPEDCSKWRDAAGATLETMEGGVVGLKKPTAAPHAVLKGETIKYPYGNKSASRAEFYNRKPRPLGRGGGYYAAGGGKNRHRTQNRKCVKSLDPPTGCLLLVTDAGIRYSGIFEVQ